jgi:autoinducer 2 (AI-2) kinase
VSRAVLTIDAGSGSCRALLFDLAGGLLGVAQREWAYQPVAGWPGGLDFDTSDSYRRILTCVHEVLATTSVRPADIQAVSATSMREGFVLYDADGLEIWACPNVDARAGREAETLIVEGIAERQYRRGGDWTSIVAPPRLRWIQRHQPDVWQRMRHLTMLGDWVLYRLTGEFCTDPSLGSSSNLFSLADRTWSAASLAELGVPASVVPRVHESGTVIGRITERVAAETGLLAGTPVVTAGADTQLALLGVGLTGPGQFATVGGTFWQTAAVLDQPLTDPAIRLRTLCHVLPGTWMMEGIGFMHGLSTRWVRDAFAPSASYLELDDLAAAMPPGANGVTYLCSNSMDARRWRQGPPTIVGFDILRPDATGLGALFRAVLEEAAYVARAHYVTLADACGDRPAHVRFAGGPSRSGVWAQILADVLGLPVEVTAVSEATCLGAAIAALVGAGVFTSLGEGAAQTVRVARTFEPDAAAQGVYEDGFGRRQELYRHMLAAADGSLAPFLWQGAGATSAS